MSELKAAIAELKKAPSVDIKGKQYTTVPVRLEVFRNHFPHYAVLTELLPPDGKYVRVKATICNESGQPISTGMAEEDRSFGPINKTSAIENCETSAIGRALAAFGLHGGEYASADELNLTFKKQDKMKEAHQKADDRAADAVGSYIDESKFQEWRASFKKMVDGCKTTDALNRILADNKALKKCHDTRPEVYEELMDYAQNREEILRTPTSDAERARLQG